MTGSLSSTLSSLPRHLPDEQTPLLQVNSPANRSSVAKASLSPNEQQEPPEVKVHEDSKPPDDEEAQDQGGNSGLAREGGNMADSKESVGLMGVISVLLLGSWVSLRHRR